MISKASLIQLKRFKNESKLIKEQPLGYITAYPDELNPLIWYFLVVGQKDTDYCGGHYIGEIHHSIKYPAEPPDYYMRTPNGRYEINKKICLSNSSYHKGDWTSTWNINSILIAFYSIWLDDKEYGISHIKMSKSERIKLADESINYNIKNYNKIYNKFDFTNLIDSNKTNKSNIIEDTKINIDNIFTNINIIDESINKQEILINELEKINF
jgi:ubiquitin-protein ligase